MLERLALVLAAAAPVLVHAQTPAPPDKSYFVFVASEGIDYVTLVRFGPRGPLIEHRTPVQLDPTELAGPRGLSVAPGGRFYYVTTGRGFPSGELVKITIAGDSNPRLSQPPDSIRGREPLGDLPAAVQVTPDGAYAWIANVGASGDAKPSSVSVVYLEQMVEVARIKTCGMPHGSRLTADGSKHYSVCMTDDMLVEINAATMRISRHFLLTMGSEHGMPGPPATRIGANGAVADTSRSIGASNPGGASCAPTWAQPTADGTRIYVACSTSNDVVEVDGVSWTMLRRIPMGEGVYNVALTHDGKLLIGTNRRGQSVSIIDLASGRELARLPTKRRLPTGLVVSPDDRYAFITVAGVGSEPGTVEIIDLRALKTVATIDVFPQAGGIDFWKMGN